MTTSRYVKKEQVYAASFELIGQGIYPTIEKVRQHLGRGSNDTISKYLRLFKEEHHKVLEEIDNRNFQIPSIVMNVFESQYNAIYRIVETQLRDEALAQAEVDMEALEEENDRLMDAVARLEAKVEVLLKAMEIKSKKDPELKDALKAFYELPSATR